MRKECECRATTMCLLIVAVVAAIYFSVHRIVDRVEAPVSANTTAPSTPALYLPAKEVPSAWQIESLEDPYTGVMTTTAMDMLDGDNSIVIRQTGAKLECYINTGRFLTGAGNRRTMVQYRFDDGEPFHQIWNISNNNSSLIYPGDPQKFLQQLAEAKNFEFQFHPADSSLQEVRYNVAGFPSEFQ